MKELTKEVNRVVEKYAKFKKGQTVYGLDTVASEFGYVTHVIEDAQVQVDCSSDDDYCILYGCRHKCNDGFESYEHEEDLYASLDDLKADMVAKYQRKAEMWAKVGKSGNGEEQDNH